MSDHPGDEKPRSSIFSSSSKPEDKGGDDKDKKDEKPASSLFGGTKPLPNIFASTKTGTSSAAPADKDKDKPGDPARSTGTNPPFGSRPPATGSNPFSSTRSTGTGGPLGSSSSTGAFNKPGQPPSSSGSGGSKGTPLGTAYDKALGDKKPDQGGAQPDEKKPESGGSKPAEASKSSAFSFIPKPATSTPAEKKPDDKKGEDNKPNEPAKPAGGGLFGRLGAKPADPEKKPDDKKPADGDKKPDQKPAEPAKPSGGGLFGRLGAKPADPEKKPDDKKPADGDKKPDQKPAEPAKPSGGGLFGRFGAKPADPEKKPDDKKPADGDKKPDQKPAEPANPSGGGLFGRFGAKPADPEKKPDDKKPAEPAKPSGATASGIPKLATGAATPPPVASAAPKDEKKPDPAPAAAPKSSGLNLFNRGGAKPPEPEKKAAEPPKPETSASAAPKIGPVAAKVDAKKDDKKDAKPAEPSARRGFLGIFRRSKKPDVAALQQAAADRKALVTAAPRPAKPIEGGTQVKVNNPGLSLDQKLDMIGYAMIVAGIIMLFGVLQPDEGTFTKALVDILGALFGYGRFLIPLPALAVGGWLLVRHFKENPLLEFDVLQLLGSVMLFLTLVTGLHFLELLQKPVLNWEELVIVSNMAVDAMQGGGWVGDRLYMILIRLSGEWGVPVLILAALIVSSMLTFEITLAEISIYIKSIFQFFGRRVASIRLSLRLWNNQRKMRAAARMQARQAKAAQKAAARAVSKPAAGPGLPAAATLAGAALTDGNGNTDGKRVLPEPAMVAMPPNKVGAAASPLRTPVPAGGTDDGPPPTLAPARPAPIRTGPSASPARIVAEAAPVTVAPDKADDLPLPTPALARPTPIRATGSTPAATGTAPEKPKSGGMFGPFGSRGKSEPAKPPESPKSEPIKAAEPAKPEPAPVMAEPAPPPAAASAPVSSTPAPTPAKSEPAAKVPEPEKPKPSGLFSAFGSRGKSEPAKPPESPKSEPIKAAEPAKPEPAPVMAEPAPPPAAISAPVSSTPAPTPAKSEPAAKVPEPEKPKSGGMFGPFGSRGKSEPAKPPEAPKSEPIKAAEPAEPEPALVTAEPTPLPTATPAKPEPAPASSATSEKTLAASAAPSTPQPASEPESGTVKVLEAVKPEAPPEPVKAVSSAESVESDLEKTQPAEITGVMKPVTAADKPAEPSAPPVVEKTPPPVAKPSSIFGAFGRPAEKPATSTSTASAPTANAPTASAQSTEQTVPTERAEKTSPMGPVKPPVPQPTKPGGGLFGALGARTDKPATPPPAKPSEPPATPKADSAEAAKVTSATPPADPPKAEEPLPPAKPAGIFGSRPPAFASTPPAFKPAPKPTGTAPKVDDPAAKANVDEIADPPPADEVEAISADAITPTAPIAPPPTIFKSGERQAPSALGGAPKFAMPSRPVEPAAKPPAPEEALIAPPAKPASSIFGAARPPFGGANKPAESAPPPPVSKPAEPPAPEPVPAVKLEPPKVPAPNPLPAISPTGWLMPNIQEVLEAGSQKAIQQEVINERSRVIEDTLRAFGAPGKVVEINVGPTITQFGVEPDYLNLRGGKRTRVKVGAIAKLDADLALALAARSIRIEAPVPGKGYVGIEVPNAEVSLVGLRDIMEDPAFMKVKSRLRIALGKSIDGTPVIADLTAMPHLLIAGTTGSGKSVCVNAIIACLLLQNSPDDLKFIMVDPKRVELTGYNGIPHLISPVVVDLERIVGVLKWVTREMDDRYKKFAAIQARNIVDYNGKIGENETKMPYLVIVIDELADLMMLAPDETERVLTRLAQMARATGIHLILSTQRPSVDVVTGLIKANFPARISFAVASSVDSRVILDQPGAEKLLGRGDMLYQAPDAAAPIRVQGVYVSDAEINRITSFWKGATSPRKDRVTPAVSFDQISEKPTAKPGGEREDRGPFGARPNRGGSPFGGPPPAAGGSASAAERDKFKDDFYNAIREPEKPTPDDLRPEDDVYAEAVELFRQTGRISVSLLQRRLKVNFNRAAKLIDLMKQRGVLDDTKLTEEE
jgi:S-DNA-T family DNA segregation ATPase FtsK/SpoIIIE